MPVYALNSHIKYDVSHDVKIHFAIFEESFVFQIFFILECFVLLEELVPLWILSFISSSTFLQEVLKVATARS